MQFCEDIEKVIKEYTRPYRDPKSHKNHKRVMAQLKWISESKGWTLFLLSRFSGCPRFRRWNDMGIELHGGETHNRIMPSRYFVVKIQRCLLPNVLGKKGEGFRNQF